MRINAYTSLALLPVAIPTAHISSLALIRQTTPPSFTRTPSTAARVHLSDGALPSVRRSGYGVRDLTALYSFRNSDMFDHHFWNQTSEELVNYFGERLDQNLIGKNGFKYELVKDICSKISWSNLSLDNYLDENGKMITDYKSLPLIETITLILMTYYGRRDRMADIQGHFATGSQQRPLEVVGIGRNPAGYRVLLFHKESGAHRDVFLCVRGWNLDNGEVLETIGKAYLKYLPLIGSAYAGFSEEVFGLLPDLVKALAEIRTKYNKPLRILGSGHSRGAAQAPLLVKAIAKLAQFSKFAEQSEQAVEGRSNNKISGLIHTSGHSIFRPPV